jgi:ketoreductase RED2
MPDFEGRVAIVTGSTSGMGAAIARRFAAEGAGVVVNSSKSREAGQELAADLPDSVYVQADVGVEAEAQRLVDAALERWGRVDVVVNNAAIAPIIDHTDLDSLTGEIWLNTLSVNLLGPWFLVKAAADALRASGDGAVVNVSSLAATRGTETNSSMAYQVSKSALNHLTVLLANALGPDIRVNALAPGRIETPLWGERREMLLASARQKIPLGRPGTVDEIADVCLFLARPGFISGQVVTVDGGQGIKIEALK